MEGKKDKVFICGVVTQKQLQKIENALRYLGFEPLYSPMYDGAEHPNVNYKIKKQRMEVLLQADQILLFDLRVYCCVTREVNKMFNFEIKAAEYFGLPTLHSEAVISMASNRFLESYDENKEEK